MSEEHIVRYTRHDLPPSQTDWARLDAMTEEEVEANALADPDNPPWTDEELRNARPVTPGEWKQVPVSLRLDPQVVEFFKQQGRGYQSRINAVLKAYVRSQERRG